MEDLTQTSDESCGEEIADISEGVNIPLEDPKLFSWVGVKVNKTVRLTRGRKTLTPDIRIGKVNCKDEKGLHIIFHEEIQPGFYINSAKTDCDIISNDNVIVLKEPKYEHNRHIGEYGYRFPKTIKSIISTFLTNKN